METFFHPLPIQHSWFSQTQIKPVAVQNAAQTRQTKELALWSNVQASQRAAALLM
jgi:hypothetical protein